MRSLEWALIQSDWGPHEKRIVGHRHTQSDDRVRTQGGDGIYTPRREALETPALPTPGPWTPCLQDGETINIC